MQREEFENRMGHTVTPEAYEDIEDLYFAAGDIDKDTFCDDYKLHGTSKILAGLWARYKTMRDDLQVYKKEHQQAAELLVKISWDYGVKEAEEQAYTMIGQRGIIKTKIQRGIDLTREEKEYIISKL